MYSFCVIYIICIAVMVPLPLKMKGLVDLAALHFELLAFSLKLFAKSFLSQESIS